MKILTVSTIFPGRAAPGQGVFIKERQSHLPEGYDVTVVRARPWFPLAGRWLPHGPTRFPAVEDVAGLTVHDLRFPYVPRLFKHKDADWLAARLDRWMARTGVAPDLLDAHFAYPAGAAAVDVGHRRGLPCVVTLRGTIGSYLGDRRRARIAEALSGATRLISVSESLAAVARDIAGARLDVRVIGNGVDTRLFSPADRAGARRRLGLPDDAEMLLTVGGLVPRKGIHRVIEVLPGVLARHPDALYLVVGGGSVEGDYGAALARQIDASGVGDHARLCGAVAHEALADYYRAADVFVLSTSNEGWANVLQEALACGAPVVTTDVGGNREVVGDDEHGTIVPFGDAGALEGAILRALGRSWDRDRIAAWGRRRDWTDVGREVAAVYEEAVRDG